MCLCAWVCSICRALLYLIRSYYTFTVSRFAFFHFDHFTSDQLVARPLREHKQRINTYTYLTSMPFVGFELTIPASE
jgi:hypothetical protein